MKKISSLIATAEIAAILAPVFAFAQTVAQPNVQNINQLLSLICGIVNLVFIVLVIIAVIFVIVAAFRYLTAGGEAEKITTANKTLIYAAVAIAVGLLAKAIPLIVGSLLGATGGGLNPCTTGAQYTPGT